MFVKGKYKILLLGRTDPMHQCTLERPTSWEAAKAVRVLVEKRLNTGHQRALVAKKATTLLGCFRKSIFPAAQGR